MSWSDHYNPALVALGRDSSSSYFARFRDGSQCWNALPTGLHNKLNGRQKFLPDVDLLVLGTEGEAFVQFKNGQSAWWGTADDFDEVLHEGYRRHGRISHLSFAPDGGYFVRFSDDWWSFAGLPDGLSNRLQGRQKHLPDIHHTAFDDSGGYWVKFQDGRSWWSASLPDELQTDLREKSVEQLILGSDGAYFIRFTNGQTSWCVDRDLEAALGYPWLDVDEIRYSNSSISQNFSSPHGTIHDLVREIEYGETDPVDVPAMRVVKEDGEYFSLDNRRLWAFKQARAGTVRVQLVETPPHFARRMQRALDDGHDIRIRGDVFW